MRVLAIVSSLLLVGLCASAEPLAVQTYTLPNGLTVILHEDHTLPMVTIDTWFHVGSKDEAPGRTGFAHLFEHLMFMGTERAPGNEFDVLMESGGGANNASTGTDRTNYYSWGPRALLPTLLWLDADRLDGLGKAMTQAKLDRQREVVRNERRQSVENRPYGKAELIIPEALYPEGHPYHHPVIGSHEDLEAATLDDVKAFFATYYVPGNASLVVAGDFDPDTARQLVAETFGAVPAGPVPSPRTAAPVHLEREVRRLVTDRVRYARLYLVWPSPAAYDDGDADMDVVAQLLADRATGRLVDRLVRQDQVAQDVRCRQDSQDLGSEFSITATAAAGADLEHLKHVILEEVAQLQADGPSDAELARVKAAIESRFLRGKESLRRRADMLNEYFAAYGEADSFDRDLARRTAPTADSVRRWARAVLGEGRLDLRILPEAAQVTGANLDERPADLPERAFVPAAPATVALKGGQPLHVLSRPGSGLFSGTVIIDGGRRLVPTAQAGLAALCATMLTRGAAGRDASAYADAVATLGGRIVASAGPSTLRIDVSGLTSHLDATLALLADAILRPSLTDADFGREKDLALAAIASRGENPRRLASVVTDLTLFGRDDPRGRPQEGYAETVGALTADDMRALVPRLLDAGRATFVFAGDVTPDEIRQALDRAFGKWKARSEAPLPALAPLAAPHPGWLLVDRPDAPQTVITITRPLTAPADAAQRAVRACVTTLFGGTFTSRLNQNVREQHGYSYGAYASIYDDAGQWRASAGAAVQSEVTGAALGEFAKEFAALASGDIADAELQKAIKSRTFDLENAEATTDAANGLLAQLVVDGRPLDALATDLAANTAVTLAGANAEARSGDYAWADMLVVLVGDRSRVLSQLRAQGLPEPIVVDGSGTPVAEPVTQHP